MSKPEMKLQSPMKYYSLSFVHKEKFFHCDEPFLTYEDVQKFRSEMCSLLNMPEENLMIGVRYAQAETPQKV